METNTNAISYMVQNADSIYRQRLHKDWNKIIKRKDIKDFHCSEKTDKQTGRTDLYCTIVLHSEKE